MERKDAVFLLLVLGVGGYYGYRYRQPIIEKLGLDDLGPGRVKSIEIVKEGFGFEQFRKNGLVMREWIRGGRVEVDGEPWNAKRQKTSDHFLVVCSYRENGEPHNRQFDVDVATGIVVDLGDTPTSPIPAAPR